MASQFPPKKNTAFTLFFTLYQADGVVIANPGTITKKVSIDGGAVANIVASVTKEDTTYGQCSVVLSAAEMNGDAIWVYITDDTVGCVPFTATIYTAGETLDEVKAETAAILVDTGTTLDTAISAIKAKTDNLPASPAATGAEMTLTAAYDAAKTAAQAGDAMDLTAPAKTGHSIGAGGIPIGAFASGAITDAAIASDAETAIAAAIKATVVEQQGTITLQQALSIILSVLAGVTADAGATFKDPSGAATRIAATVNASNERTAITLTPSA